MGWRKGRREAGIGKWDARGRWRQGCGDRVRGPIAQQGEERQDSVPPLSALGKEPQLRSSRPILSALFHLSPQTHVGIFSTHFSACLCLSHLYPDHASQDLSLSPASSPVPVSGSSQEHHPRK